MVWAEAGGRLIVSGQASRRGDGKGDARTRLNVRREPPRSVGRIQGDVGAGAARPAESRRPRSLLPRVLTAGAPDSKGQRTQAFTRDGAGAFDAVAVGVGVESPQCRVNPAERLGFHLYQGEIEIGLDVNIGAVVRVHDIPIVSISLPHIAHHAVHAVGELLASRFENRSQFGTAPCRRPHGGIVVTVGVRHN